MAYREAKCESGRKRRKFDHTEIRDGKDGGHVVEHHFDNSGNPGSYKRPDSYPFSTGPEMIKHVMDAHGVKEAEMAAHLNGDNEEEPGGGEDEDGED